MYLKKLRLWNWRKFQSSEYNPGIEVTFKEGLNILIGQNDSGKTAIVDAIRIALGTNNNDINWVTEEDFSPGTNELKIECSFGDLTEKEKPYFLEWLSFPKGESQDTTLRILLTANLLEHFVKCHYDKYGYHLWQSALESVLNRLNHIDYTIDGFDVQISDSRSWANSWEKLINYKNRFEVSIGEYFKAGNINLSEAQKLIQSIISNQEYDINLLSRRFPFVFIDEYQDQMNNTFLNLLENLKENKVMVQMIGDANQQIYYGQPYYEKESLLFNYYNLNITNRFSNQIAQPLNNMFKGSLEPASFTKSEKPILYIYESPENIINFIDFFPEKDSGILVLEHKHAKDFKLATQNVKENQISMVQKITDKLIGILAERLAKPKSQCKQILMRKYEEDYIELNKFILNGIQNKNEEHDEKDFLRNLNEVLSCEKVSNIRSNNSIIQDFFSSLNKILLDANQKRRTVPVSTIHGVKGLTFNSICVYLQEDSVLQNAFLHSYELDSDKEFNAIYKRILST